MTRSELIRKISKSAGVSDSETKLFFEIFLKRVSSMILLGQAVKVKEFGYFYLLNGRVNQSRANFIDENDQQDLTELVLFSTTKNIQDGLNEGLIFNTPTVDEEYHVVDSYFSLSIGKPLIPLKGNTSEDFFIPTGGYEIRRLIESKVEKILEDAELIPESLEEPPLIILTSQAFNTSKIELQMKREEADLKLDEEIPESFIDSEKSISDANLKIQHVAWDFGENISKKLEEDEILDIPDSEIVDEENENIVQSKIEAIEQTVNTEILESTVEEIIQSEIKIDDEIKPDEKIFVEEEKIKLSESDIDETLEDTDEILKKTELYKPFKPGDESEEKNSEELKEVTSSTSTYKYEPFKLDKSDTDKFTFEKAIKEKEKLPIEKVELKVTPTIDENKKERKVEKHTQISKDDFFERRHKKSKVPLLIVIIGSALIATMLYFYFTQIKDISKTQGQSLTLNTSQSNIIERDYKIPVTYPYPKREQNDVESNILPDQNVENQDQENQKTTKDFGTPKIEISDTKPTPPPVVSQNNRTENFVRVEPNIFKYKDYYAVQVASFRSSSIAENEAGRYRNKGFNSFVERAEIQGMGVWHRVKVGNFTSLNEAKEFQLKNK